MKKRIIKIFDTTLRDGEQSPGASLDAEEKVEIAVQLEKMKVDVIEAGFSISSPGDFHSVELVAKNVKNSAVAALARSIQKDIDAAYESLKKAVSPRIHVFLATSKIHREYKLKKAQEEILKLAVDAVRYAKKKVPDVQFSPEDASRTELVFLARVVEAVIDAGATTVNIPDTVGYSIPEEFGGIIRYLMENVSNIDKAVIAVHCHNDLGLAVANSLAAIRAGAGQVECTVNGIGERAGNASLEEIVMGIKTRKDFFEGVMTNIDSTMILKTSKLVSRLTNIFVQPNKAIVGSNAFAHESGIHQDGILKKRETYEIIDPREVGFSESKLVLGKHSGRHAFREHVEKLGFRLPEEKIEKAFEGFKSLADKKKTVYDEDIIAIVEDEIGNVPEIFHLEYLSVTSGSRPNIPTATVKVRKDKDVYQDAACGDGPVDATYKAIERISGIQVELVDYSIKSVTRGKDALGEVSLKVRSPRGSIFTGRGTSTDIIEASAQAFINALNKIVSYEKEKTKRKTSPKL
ncbi:MAG: 2-isopropylmalate synthase [Candidatus Aureabacteria bacterium]|nr:2-isopropylmalate synthase [Candidatus Auribacterota bacterium]